MHLSLYWFIPFPAALVILFSYGLSQGLIMIPCHHSTIDGWWLYVVEAFNLIEFFAVAALFGWFTFLIGTGDLMKRFRQIKIETLTRINDYFILSFLFYAAAALADYFFSHVSVFGQKYMFGALTVSAFLFGTLILAWPVVYLLLLEHKQEIHIQRVGHAFILFVLTFVNIMALVLVLSPSDEITRGVMVLIAIPTILGLLLAMARDLTIRSFIWRFLSLAVISWIAWAIFVLVF